MQPQAHRCGVLIAAAAQRHVMRITGNAGILSLAAAVSVLFALAGPAFSEKAPGDWKEFRSRLMGVSFKAPADAKSTEHAGQNVSYFRIERINKAVRAEVGRPLEPSEFYVEVMVSSGTQLPSCDLLLDAKPVRVGKFNAVRGPGGEAAEGEGNIDQLCLDTGKRRLDVQGTGSFKSMALVKRILDSFSIDEP